MCECTLCVAGVPLAESQCEAEWRGRHGPAAEDHRGSHCGQPQEEVHGQLHLCILAMFGGFRNYSGFMLKQLKTFLFKKAYHH